MNDIDLILREKIKDALLKVEESGDIVIVTTILNAAAEVIAEKTKEAYIGEMFTHEELVFLQQLTNEASYNDNIFHGEMRTMTNYDQDAANKLSQRIKKFITYYK